jgi:Leucine-rich repeat (LRR) protein
MKPQLFKWKALLLSATILFFTACSSDDDNNDPIVDDLPDVDVVHFNDAILLQEVKNILGLGEDDPVTPENILALEVLDLSGNLTFIDISDLTGLEYAKNITYLRFGETAVTNLSPISGLRKVEYLRFNNTAITDISALSGYTTLTYFNANSVTGLTDISPLAGNTGIQEIILRDVPFGNAGMATIANFTSMYRLNMRGSGVTDLTVLGELMAGGALQNSTPGASANGGATLDLRGLAITDWRPIAPYIDNVANQDGIPSNAPVSVPDSRLAAQIKLALDIPETTSLTNLYMLSLTELSLAGEDDLSPNGDIRDIADLTGLEAAENITYLRFGGTAVTDLTPIAGLNNVEYLRFNNTGITDISALSSFTTLTYFNANTTTGITDISPLSGNTGLQELILRNVPFGDAGMPVLANFTSMYRLNMRATGVTDITVLGNLMAQGALLDSTPGAAENGGASLDLRNNDITDFSPIKPYIGHISNLQGYN